MGQFRRVMSAGTLVGDPVYNTNEEQLGKVDEIMLDVVTGKVAYVVVSTGGLLGVGSRLFAVPWHVLRLDEEKHRFVLDISKEKFDSAPGFDKDNWPDMASDEFTEEMTSYYYDLSAFPNPS